MINFQIHELWNPKLVLETTEKNMELFQFKRAMSGALHTHTLFPAWLQESQVSDNKTKNQATFKTLGLKSNLILKSLSWKFQTQQEQ